MKVEAEFFGCSSWTSSLAPRNREKYSTGSNFMRTSGILQMCSMFFVPLSHVIPLSVASGSSQAHVKAFLHVYCFGIPSGFSFRHRILVVSSSSLPKNVLCDRLCGEKNADRDLKRKKISDSVLSEASKGSDGNPRKAAVETVNTSDFHNKSNSGNPEQARRRRLLISLTQKSTFNLATLFISLKKLRRDQIDLN